MAKGQTVIGMKVRLNKLQTNGKNDDSPGVVNKLKRKIRRFEGNDR